MLETEKPAAGILIYKYIIFRWGGALAAEAGVGSWGWKPGAMSLASLDSRDRRSNGEGSTLADLYDPNTMPADLLKAHQSLDKAVDKAYAAPKFTTEAERVKYLFALYQTLTAPLEVASKPAKKRVRKKRKA